MNNREIAERIVSEVFGVEVVAKDETNTNLAKIATDVFNRVMVKDIERILNESYPESGHAATHRIQPRLKASGRSSVRPR